MFAGRTLTCSHSQWLYASSIVYCPVAYFTKVVLLLMIARVFAVMEKVSRAIHIFVLFLLICYIPVQVVKTAICVPIAAIWDPRIVGENCVDQRKVFIYDTLLAIVSDFVILFVPLLLTLRLRLGFWKKFKIVFLLGIGGCAVAVTTFKMYLVILFLDSTDVTSDFVTLDLIT